MVGNVTAAAFSTSTSTSTSTASSRRPWILRRWPTWLAVALAVLTIGGGAAGLAEALLLLPLLYLVVAVLRRRRASWPVLVVTIAGYVGLETLDLIDPSAVVVGVAVVAFIVGVALPGRVAHASFWVQVVGMIAFGALTFLAMGAEPGLALWLVAAGWFAHGLWDLAHLWADKVVSRSYAEWCAVVDVLVGIQLVVLT
jgi:hypothetical protein